MTASNAANWALGKRAFHWALALAVLVALVAPKPEDEGGGLVHIAAGTTALALVLARLGQRLLGEVRPFVKDAWRLKWPDLSKGVRGFAPFMMQGARIGGFLFLALIPVAVGLALVGIGQGEESPLLEAHEAVGTTIMALAIAHAVGIIMFALITRYDLVGVTLLGGARSFLEGGARGAAGLALGAMLGVAALAYLWGPFDIAAKATAVGEGETGGEDGRNEDHDDD
jgi:cytochrome b561